jgi:small subunit ribosomal protein S7
MPRRNKKIPKRDIGVDPRFHSSLIQKFINVAMQRGKKNLAQSIVYDAMDYLVRKAGGDEKKGLELFMRAFDQIAPHVEVRSRRVGGSVYQIPVEVRTERRQALALRWLLKAAAARPGNDMGARLGPELLDAIEGRGGAVKKRSEVQRMAEANRAFSHYAW